MKTTKINTGLNAVLAVCAVSLTFSITDYLNLDDYKAKIKSLESDVRYEEGVSRQKDEETKHFKQLYFGTKRDYRFPPTIMESAKMECAVKKGKIVLDTHNFCKVDKDGHLSFTAPMGGRYSVRNASVKRITKENK